MSAAIGVVALALSLAVLPWAYDFGDVLLDGRLTEERYELDLESLYRASASVASDGGPTRAWLTNYLRWGVYALSGVAVTTAFLARGRRSIVGPVGIVATGVLVHAGFTVYVMVDLPYRPGPGLGAFLAALLALGASVVLAPAGDRPARPS